MTNVLHVPPCLSLREYLRAHFPAFLNSPLADDEALAAIERDAAKRARLEGYPLKLERERELKLPVYIWHMVFPD